MQIRRSPRVAALIGLLSAFAVVSQVPAPQASAATELDLSTRVGTFNVCAPPGCTAGGDGTTINAWIAQQRYQEVADEIEASGADLVMLQEAGGNADDEKNYVYRSSVQPNFDGLAPFAEAMTANGFAISDFSGSDPSSTFKNSGSDGRRIAFKDSVWSKSDTDGNLLPSGMWCLAGGERCRIVAFQTLRHKAVGALVVAVSPQLEHCDDYTATACPLTGDAAYEDLRGDEMQSTVKLTKAVADEVSAQYGQSVTTVIAGDLNSGGGGGKDTPAKVLCADGFVNSLDVAPTKINDGFTTYKKYSGRKNVFVRRESADFKLDQIWVQPDVGVSRWEMRKQPETMNVSDHDMVVADLTVRNSNSLWMSFFRRVSTFGQVRCGG